MNRHLPIFAAHGLEDSVVSMVLGKQAIQLIESFGYLPEWHTYPMAHEVCVEEVSDIGKWLRRQMFSQDNATPVAKTVLQPYSAVASYVTKDGSEIRELMHPKVHGNQAQSLAEATIPAGTRTLLHRHGKTEEIYHVTAGTGLMTLGTKSFPVEAGDTVLIPPGTPHCIEALGDTSLRILCCCSPAYAHSDTELLS